MSRPSVVYSKGALESSTSVPLAPGVGVDGTEKSNDHLALVDNVGDAEIEPLVESDTESDSDNQASRKRPRPLDTSCELCKQRKVKCDKIHPTCGWCARNNRVCEYRAKKKPGARAGLGRVLEARIEDLENRLRIQTLKLDEHLSLACRPAEFSSPQDGNVSVPLANQHHEYSVTATSHPEVQQSPSHWQLGATSFEPRRPRFNHGNSWAGGINEHPSGQYLATNYDNGLPSPEILHDLVNLYFENINPWAPILEEQTTRDTLFASTLPDESDLALLHAIVAVSLRFFPENRLTPYLRKQYYDQSKQKVQQYGIENSNIRSLQALLILSLDVLGNSNGPQGWNLLALMTRNVIQLGLSVEKNSNLGRPDYPSIAILRAFVLPEPKSWIEDEERRRLFWMVYVLDRHAIIATAFDFMLDEKTIDRQLPCRNDLFVKNQSTQTRRFQWLERYPLNIELESNLGSFSYYCEVLGILTKIHQFLKKPVNIALHTDVETWQNSYRALNGELSAWFNNLTRGYKNYLHFNRAEPGNKNPNLIMLHAIYQSSVIRLHSSAAYPSVRSNIFQPSYNAMQYCLMAVESIKSLTQDVVQHGRLTYLGPPFAFCLWVSARVLLVHGSTVQNELDPALGFFISTLEQMGKYWQVAQRYAKTLKRVLHEYETARESNNGDPGNEALSAVKILVDMRRNAYDLEFLLSQQQPLNSHVTARGTPASLELEQVDIFDFFNYPRLPTFGESLDPHLGPDTVYSSNGIYPASGFMIPDPQIDWFTLETPME